MRILKVVNSNDGGGVFACEMQFIKELKSKDVVVDIVIVGNGDKFDEYKNVCSKAYYVPAIDVAYTGSAINILRAIRRNYSYGLNMQKNSVTK